MPQHNYSEDGWYFTTICTKNYEPVFGKIQDGQIQLSPLGKIAEQCWLDLPNHYPNCQLDEFIIMPNHVHGIIIIENPAPISVRTGLKPVPNPNPKKHSLSEIVRGFKTFSSRKINTAQNEFLFRWQRSFYDHIIRNEKSLEKIRTYIYFNVEKHLSEKNLISFFE